MLDTIVVGSGIAGLTGAIRLAESGKKVALISFGHGGLQLSQGSVDVFGYSPDLVENPLEAAQSFGDISPDHPYAKIPAEALREGLECFSGFLGSDLLVGCAQTNQLFPTAAGAMRPTALYPPSWEAGRVQDGKHYLIVGLDQYKDFYPELIAGNLSRCTGPQGQRVTAEPLRVSFPARDGEADSSAMNYARLLDTQQGLNDFIEVLRPCLQGAADGVVGLPAFLGLEDPFVYKKLSQKLGREVFEIPCLPPSPGGLRFFNKLLSLAKSLRVRVVTGASVNSFTFEGDRISSLGVQVAGRQQDWVARSFLYAPGGFESGALQMNSYMQISEKVFNLPLQGADLKEPTHADYWGAPQPLFLAGVRVDQQMRPLDENGGVVWKNLRCAGGILGGANRWDELCGDGIALGSAWAATSSLLQEAF